MVAITSDNRYIVFYIVLPVARWLFLQLCSSAYIRHAGRRHCTVPTLRTVYFIVLQPYSIYSKSWVFVAFAQSFIPNPFKQLMKENHCSKSQPKQIQMYCYHLGYYLSQTFQTGFNRGIIKRGKQISTFSSVNKIVDAINSSGYSQLQISSIEKFLATIKIYAIKNSLYLNSVRNVTQSSK